MSTFGARVDTRATSAVRVAFDVTARENPERVAGRDRPQLHDAARLLYELEFTVNRACYVVRRDERGIVRSMTRADVELRRIRFGSPLEVVLISSASVVILHYLRLLRDWATDKRIRNTAGLAENELGLHRALTLRVIRMIEDEGFDEALLKHLAPQSDGQPVGIVRIAEFARQIEDVSFVADDEP